MRETAIAIAIGLVCAVAVAHYTGESYAAELAAEQERHDSLTKKFAELQAVLAEVPRLKTEIRRLERGLTPISASYLHIDDLLAETAKIAKQSRVKLGVFQPAKRQRIAGTDLAKLPLHLEVEGDFNEIMAFLRGTKRGFYNIYLADVSLIVKKGAVQAKIEGMVVHRLADETAH